MPAALNARNSQLFFSALGARPPRAQPCHARLRGKELVERALSSIRGHIPIDPKCSQAPADRSVSRASRTLLQRPPTKAWRSSSERETGALGRRAVGVGLVLSALRQTNIGRFEGAKTRGERTRLADLHDGEPGLRRVSRHIQEKVGIAPLVGAVLRMSRHRKVPPDVNSPSVRTVVAAVPPSRRRVDKSFFSLANSGDVEIEGGILLCVGIADAGAARDVRRKSLAFDAVSALASIARLRGLTKMDATQAPSRRQRRSSRRRDCRSGAHSGTRGANRVISIESADAHDATPKN